MAQDLVINGETYENVEQLEATNTEGGVVVYSEGSDRLPPVTSADNGKFMRVVNGKWAAVALTDVSEVGT